MSALDIPAARQLIDGAWVPALDQRELPVLDPANGKAIRPVARGGQADVDAAVAAARRAFPAWAATSPT
mgnify:FL=1